MDQWVLDEIVKRLVAAVEPDRIILFGSRARGENRPDSDFDLLIVKDTAERPHRRTIPAYRALRGMGVAKDILWYTPSEVDEWRATVNHVVHDALEQGKVLYERQ